MAQNRSPRKPGTTRGLLTDSRCRSAKPAERPYKLSDEKGLYLEVKPNGVKAWRYRFELSIDGVRKENIFAIGEYAHAPNGESEEDALARRQGGRFTLAEARVERAKARGLVKQGVSPVQQRQLERLRQAQDRSTTFESVARTWLSLRDWEEITKRKRLDMLERTVFRKVGEMPIKDIKSAHILSLLKFIHEHNGISVANEAKRTISRIFEFAVSNLLAETDPVYVVRHALPANKTQHRRALTKEEIGQLFRDLDGYERNFLTVGMFRLMWFTLCRPSEVAGALWSEFDLDNAIWRIGSERMKKRREHVVPLPRQAVELLRSLYGMTGHLPHVFPHRDRRHEAMTDHTLRAALNTLGWGKRYSPHATRATGSTRLNELGFPADWIERQLAHADTNAVRRTYNHAEYLEQRTKMMQQWADLLDAWKVADEKVVPLKVGVA